MKIHISEKDMPISCYGCVCYDGENGRCKVLDTYLEGEHIPRICPLKSLEQHDNEVRREFAEKIKKALEKYRLENEEFINGQWIINASILCAEFTNGILDEIAAEFGKED